MSIGKFCLKAREKAGLTQANLAEAMGYVSPQFISNIERGVAPFPVAQAKLFIKLTKCDPNELYDSVLNYYGSRISKYFPKLRRK